MAFNVDLSRLKNPCLVRTNLILPIIKALLLFAIWQGLKPFVALKDLWIVPIWVALGFLIDFFILLKKPKIFKDIDLNEEDQQAYGLSAEELSRYLNFSPKVRIGRTLISLFLTPIICFFWNVPDWSFILMFVLFFAFIILDPPLQYVFKIKTPLLYENSTDSYKLNESFDEIHKNDINWVGSPAWTAWNSIRQFDDFPKR